MPYPTTRSPRSRFAAALPILACLSLASACSRPSEPQGTGETPTTSIPGGNSAESAAAGDPIVDRFLPDGASVEGGIEVTLLGNHFTNGTTVIFGDAVSPEVKFISNTQLRVKLPANREGFVNVTLLDLQGRKVTLTNAFEYRSLLRVDSILPSSGPAEGGAMSTIVGRGFDADTRVVIDGIVVPNIVVESDTLIRLTLPAYPQVLRDDKKVNVRIAHPVRGSVTLTEGYTYKAPSQISFTAIVPNRDDSAGGRRVTIQGAGFTSKTSVFFGNPDTNTWEPASATFVSAEMLTVTVPPHAPGSVALRFIDPNGRSHIQRDAFTFNPLPTLSITSVAPLEGPAEGGLRVTVTGTGFDEKTQVLFGGLLGSDVKVFGGTALSAVLPPHAEGNANVEVLRGNGTRASWANKFTYQPPIWDPTPPRLVSAIAISNTEVLVQYSKPMSLLEAAKTANYEFSNAHGADLIVTSATVADVEMKRFRLTTLSQGQVTYDLRVTNVTDAKGIPPAAPLQASFKGSPPRGTPPDTDNDGLTDRDEMLGWTVTLTQSNGERFTRTATSDPFVADTDGDSLSDNEENTLATDPRSRDTDADSIADKDELKIYASNPAKQDSDGDSLSDPQELILKTSLILADTDGDKWKDSEELFVRNRNPLISDIPVLQIEIGEMRIDLDQRYSYTDRKGESKSTTESSSTELTQGTEKSRTKSDSHATSSTWERHFELELQVKSGVEQGFPTGTVTVTASGGMSWSDTAEHTSTMEESAAESASKTIQQGAERVASFDTVNEVTREIEGANMSVSVNLLGAGDLAFSVGNLELSALQLDPNGRGRFLPVATLLPSLRAEEKESPTYSLGPLLPMKGPIIFQSQNIFPKLAEELLKNPTGLIFKISNYDLVDEGGRNFAFASQDLNERTARITIDYGNGKVERYHVAVASTFDPLTGKPVFRKMGYVLNDILGIKLPADLSEEDPVLSGEPTAEQLSSFGMRLKNGKRTFVRFRDVQTNLVNPAQSPRFWALFASDPAVTANVHFDEMIVKPGVNYTFTYVEDRDNDGLFASEEWTAGSNDLAPDTDQDSLLDVKEVKQGVTISRWKANPVSLQPQHVSYKAYSNPRVTDSDGDGIPDVAEYNRTVKVNNVDVPAPTDPSLRDTDEDGLSDRVERDGYLVTLRKNGQMVQVTSDPLNPDTDGDRLTDLAELRLGADPRVQDAGTVLDDDEDSIVNDDETNGLVIIVNGKEKRVSSDPALVDSDSDGLSDPQERELKLDPKSIDTDGDTLRDKTELDIHKTKPSEADSDNDTLNDNVELAGWSITVWDLSGQPKSMDVTSNPNKLNSDPDGWTDNEEKTAGTNPMKEDTDGDGTFDNVEKNMSAEVHGPRDPKIPDQRLRIGLTELFTHDDCDGAFQGDGEFEWYIWLDLNRHVHFSFWNESYNGAWFSLTDGETKQLPSGHSKTIVKKYWETIDIGGWFAEVDSGHDYKYELPITKIGSGWQSGNRLSFSQAPECHIDIRIDVQPY